MNNLHKWNNGDFTSAMLKAVSQYANSALIKTNDEKVLFNGFWRRGNRQNVCMWLDKATWHDAKTGDGGGCKEFAKTAFNLELTEFMGRFSNVQQNSVNRLVETIGAVNKSVERKPLVKSVNLIWLEMLKSTPAETSTAVNWFTNERGFTEIEKFVDSGFTCLSEGHVNFFEERHRGFIRQRLKLGKQLVVPIRGVHSDQVKNLLFRTISICDKNDKIRLLPEAGGWSEPDNSPRAFGFPHRYNEFSTLVICEGMADYIAAECLLKYEDKYLPIGAANADALLRWALWLGQNKYSGRTVMIYHLDRSKTKKLSLQEVGPLKAIEALAILKKYGCAANLFNWLAYIENITNHPDKIHDLADSLKTEAINQECGPGHLPYCFLFCLREKIRSA